MVFLKAITTEIILRFSADSFSRRISTSVGNVTPLVQAMITTSHTGYSRGTSLTVDSGI